MKIIIELCKINIYQEYGRVSECKLPSVPFFPQERSLRSANMLFLSCHLVCISNNLSIFIIFVSFFLKNSSSLHNNYVILYQRLFGINLLISLHYLSILLFVFFQCNTSFYSHVDPTTFSLPLVCLPSASGGLFMEKTVI